MWRSTTVTLTVVGVPPSNWTELSPYSLYGHRHQCERPGSPMGTPSFQSTLVNQSIAYIESKSAGPNLGYFNTTSDWTKIVPLPWTSFSLTLLVPSQQWQNYLYARHTNDPFLRITVSCDLPDGYWWLCGNGVVCKQLDRTMYHGISCPAHTDDKSHQFN